MGALDKLIWILAILVDSLRDEEHETPGERRGNSNRPDSSIGSFRKVPLLFMPSGFRVVFLLLEMQMWHSGEKEEGGTEVVITHGNMGSVLRRILDRRSVHKIDSNLVQSETDIGFEVGVRVEGCVGWLGGSGGDGS